MPFQGESMTTLSPEAMPRANRSLAFQAATNALKARWWASSHRPSNTP